MDHLNAIHSIKDKDESDIMQMNPSKAIEMIMDMYGDKVKRLVFTYVQNKVDTDDVSQEVFVTVYQKLNTFQGKSSLRSWIYAIAINQSKDHLRSWQSRNKRLKNKLIQSAPFLQRKSETTEEYLINQAQSNRLLILVMKLSVIYREVIILYYFKELSTLEVSELLNMREATVRTRLARAREKLKQLLLKERGEHLG